jgi:hypothetical protein
MTTELIEKPATEPAQDDIAHQAMADEYQREAIASAQSLMPDDCGEL